jgi:hypothetical protein
MVYLVKQNLLRTERTAGRVDEGAARGDDGTVAARHPRVVPEQTMQRQEEGHSNEAADAAREGEERNSLDFESCLLRTLIDR